MCPGGRGRRLWTRACAPVGDAPAWFPRETGAVRPSRRKENAGRSSAVGPLRQAHGTRGRVAQGRARRDRRHAGCQRRRQIIVPESAGRHGPPYARRTHYARRRRHLRPGAARGGGGRARARAGGSRHLCRSHGARKFAARRLPTAGARAGSGEPAACAHVVSASRRAHGPVRPHHERRRAADGCHRPRADVEPRHPAAGRAVAGSLTAGVQGAVPGAVAYQGAGRRRAAGGAECQAGARHRRPRLLVGERTHRRRRSSRAAAGRSGRAPRISGRGLPIPATVMPSLRRPRGR